MSFQPIIKQRLATLIKTAATYFTSHKKIAVSLVILVVLAIWPLYTIIQSQTTTEIQYQTSTAEIGSLVSSVSGSGTISSGNSTNITTATSGVVSKVYVANGDTVKKGQKLAEIMLDSYASQQRTTAWVAYLDAQEAVKTAEKNKVAADITMWEARQAIIDAEEIIEQKNGSGINPETNEEYTVTERTVIDKNLTKNRLAFDEAELKYKNADSEIQKAKAKVAAAWTDYAELSPTITSPASGVVSNLALTEGVTIENTSNSTNSSSTQSSTVNSELSISSQKIGQIDNTGGQFRASVSLSEVDVVAVSANQKVTLTMDAFPDITFTGKVLTIDTSGTSTSGVTTYPVTIVMDPTTARIYQNMAVSAEIITSITHSVLLIPTAAITESGDQTSVKIMKDGAPATATITTGETNGTQTVVLSGLTAGDEVVTSSSGGDDSTTSARNSNTSTPFGSTGGFGGGNFGGPR